MAAEDEARAARRGLWQGEFLYPWDFRHGTGAPVTADSAGPLPGTAVGPQPSAPGTGAGIAAAAAPAPAEALADADFAELDGADEVAEEVTLPTGGAGAASDGGGGGGGGGGADRECAIKGNISRSGARIYHVPGSPSYDATQIDEARGERWFCSEAEARAAGWRAPGGR